MDEQIKAPADEQQLAILLSLLDMTNFIQFRNAVSILTCTRHDSQIIENIIKFAERLQS